MMLVLRPEAAIKCGLHNLTPSNLSRDALPASRLYFLEGVVLQAEEVRYERHVLRAHEVAAPHADMR